MSIVVNDVKEIVDMAREKATKISEIEKAAKAVKDAVIHTKRSEVNSTYRHEIILAFVCSFVEAAKEAYPGAIIMTVPNPIWIPGSCALGCAIGLMETFLAINEVPWNTIVRLEENAYDFESWYDSEDDDMDIKEAKDNEKKSINLQRLFYVRGLVGKIMTVLGKDWVI